MKSLKLLFVLLLFVFVALPAYSQKKNKVLKQVTKDICNCFTKINQDGSPLEIKNQAEECLITGMVNNYQDLEKAYNIKEEDTSMGQEIGEEIATKLLNDCPCSAGIFMIIGTADDSEVENNQGND